MPDENFLVGPIEFEKPHQVFCLACFLQLQFVVDELGFMKLQCKLIIPNKFHTTRSCRKQVKQNRHGEKSQEDFLKRLRTIATSLPKSYIKSVIARMKRNLKALVEAKGYTPKND